MTEIAVEMRFQPVGGPGARSGCLRRDQNFGRGCPARAPGLVQTQEDAARSPRVHVTRESAGVSGECYPNRWHTLDQHAARASSDSNSACPQEGRLAFGAFAANVGVCAPQFVGRPKTARFSNTIKQKFSLPATGRRVGKLQVWCVRTLWKPLQINDNCQPPSGRSPSGWAIVFAVQCLTAQFRTNSKVFSRPQRPPGAIMIQSCQALTVRKEVVCVLACLVYAF